MKVMEIDSNE